MEKLFKVKPFGTGLRTLYYIERGYELIATFYEKEIAYDVADFLNARSESIKEAVKESSEVRE
jgi:hypothetical protein